MPLRTLALGGDTPAVDIVAVHGLNPRGKKIEDHAWDTWRTPPGPNGRLWLRDYLPNDVPTARILLYEYDSTVLGSNKEKFVDAGNTLLEWLRVAREPDPKRPLLFICHSLGGLLVKQALVNAKANEYYGTIRDSVFALVFFGTPHEGGNTSLVRVGTTATHIAKYLGFGTNESIVMALKSGSVFADCLRESFRHQLENYLIVSFWEGRGNVVSKESATFGLTGTRENIVRLEADHRSMCKFNLACAEDKDNYTLVMGNLSPIIAKAAASRPAARELSPEDLALALLDGYYAAVKNTNEKHDTIMSPETEDDISWVTATSQYESWLVKQKPHVPSPNRVLWCVSGNTVYAANHFSSAFQQKDMSVFYVDCQRMLTPPAASVPAILETKLPTVLVHDAKSVEQSFRKTLWALGLEEQVAQTHRVWRIMWELLVQSFTIALPESPSQSFGHYVVSSIPQGNKMPGDSLTNVAIALGKLFDRWIESPTVILDNLDTLDRHEFRLLDRAVASLLQNSHQLKLMLISKSVKDVELQDRALLIDEDTAYNGCSNTFYFPNMTLRRDHIATASVDTNSWIWSNSSYLSWVHEPSVSALWIAGKPGSGKSVLARTLEANLTSQEIFHRAVVPTWFYSVRDKLTSHREMLSALLYQMLRGDKSVFKWISRDYQKKRGIQANDIQWSFDELKGLFKKVVCNQNLDKPFVFVLDGIDESSLKGVQEEGSRAAFLQYLLDVIVFSPTGRIKIIFLSRLEDDIRSKLRKLPSIVMHQVNSKDIAKVTDLGIKDILEELQNFQDSDEDEEPDSYDGRPTVMSETSLGSGPKSAFKEARGAQYELIQHLREYLINNADGVILWVSSVLSHIQMGIGSAFCTLPQLVREVQKLSTELSDIYITIVRNMAQMTTNSFNIALAQRALLWVRFNPAVGRFYAQDLLEVLSLQSDGPWATITGWSSFNKQLNRLCGPFLEIVSTEKGWKCGPFDPIQLLHHTVKTFLDDPVASAPLYLSEEESQRRFDSDCKIYIQRVFPQVQSENNSSAAGLISVNEALDILVENILSYLEETPLLSFVLTFNPEVVTFIPPQYKEILKVLLVTHPDASNFGLKAIFKLSYQACRNGQANALCAFFALSSTWLHPWEWYLMEPEFFKGAIQAAQEFSMNYALSKLYCYASQREILTDILPKGDPTLSSRTPSQYMTPSQPHGAQGIRGGEGFSFHAILHPQPPAEHYWPPLISNVSEMPLGPYAEAREISIGADIDMGEAHLQEATTAEVYRSLQTITAPELSGRDDTESDPPNKSESVRAIDEILAFWVNLAKSPELHSPDAFKGEAHLADCPGIAWRMAIIHSTVRNDAKLRGRGASIRGRHNKSRWGHVRFSDGIRSTVTPHQEGYGELSYGLELGGLARALRRLEEAPTGVGPPTLATAVWRENIRDVIRNGHLQREGGILKYKYLPIIPRSLNLDDF